MFKKIVILGDSFTYGHGCADRQWYYHNEEQRWIGDHATLCKGPSDYAWPTLLQKDNLDSKVYNLGMPGLDNLGMLTVLLANPEAYIGADLIILSTSVSDRILIKEEYRNTPWYCFYGLEYPKDTNVDWDLILKHGFIVGPNYVDTSINNSLNTDEARDAFNKFMTYCHHDGRSIQTAWSTVLSVAAVAQSQRAMFIWAPPSYCVANQNANALPVNLDYCIMANLHDFVLKKPEFQAVDTHANEVGHANYYHRVVQPTLKKLYRD